MKKLYNSALDDGFCVPSLWSKAFDTNSQHTGRTVGTTSPIELPIGLSILIFAPVWSTSKQTRAVPSPRVQSHWGLWASFHISAKEPVCKGQYISWLGYKTSSIPTAAWGDNHKSEAHSSGKVFLNSLTSEEGKATVFLCPSTSGPWQSPMLWHQLPPLRELYLGKLGFDDQINLNHLSLCMSK